MKGNGLAFVAFALVVALIVGTGFYADFWSNVAPYILHRGGPLGLDGSFAASLVSGGIGVLVQVAFTFLLVTVLLGRQVRSARLRNRSIIARQLCGLFASTATKFAGYTIQPSRGSDRYDSKAQLFEMLSAQFNEDALTLEEESEVTSLNDLFDQVVFDRQVQVLPIFQGALKNVLKQLVRQSALTKLWSTLRRKELPRQALCRQVNDALGFLLSKRQAPVVAEAA